MSFYFRPSQHYVNFYLYFHSLTTPIKTEIRNAVHGLLAVCCCVYFIFKVKILSQKLLALLELWGMGSCQLLRVPEHINLALRAKRIYLSIFINISKIQCITKRNINFLLKQIHQDTQSLSFKIIVCARQPQSHIFHLLYYVVIKLSLLLNIFSSFFIFFRL